MGNAASRELKTSRRVSGWQEPQRDRNRLTDQRAAFSPVRSSQAGISSSSAARSVSFSHDSRTFRFWAASQVAGTRTRSSSVAKSATTRGRRPGDTTRTRSFLPQRNTLSGSRPKSLRRSSIQAAFRVTKRSTKILGTCQGDVTLTRPPGRTRRERFLKVPRFHS